MLLTKTKGGVLIGTGTNGTGTQHFNMSGRVWQDGVKKKLM